MSSAYSTVLPEGSTSTADELLLWYELVVPNGYVPNLTAEFVVIKAPMLSKVPGTPSVLERLRPSVFPVKVIAPVALYVARKTRGIGFAPLKI